MSLAPHRSQASTFAARWLVPRLGRFTSAHPDIDVEFESSDALRVVGRDADIAIRFLKTSARKPKGRARRLFVFAGPTRVPGHRHR
jgi:DNA-binding transcriptional LysR family regulator